MTTRETIETYYASVNRGDWDTLADAVHRTTS